MNMKTRILRLATAFFIAITALVFLGTFVSLATPAEPSIAGQPGNDGTENGVSLRRVISPTVRPDSDSSQSDLLARRAISIPFKLNSDGSESGLLAMRTISIPFKLNSDASGSSLLARRVISPSLGIDATFDLVEGGQPIHLRREV
jgi:hypothetical protein